MTAPFPGRLKAVIFDLDGTLIDTAPEFVTVVQKLRAEHQLEPMPPALISANVSNGARALVTLALDLDTEHPVFESKRLRLLELYQLELGTAARPYPGIEQLIADLVQHGVAWGISTNKPSAYAVPLMQMLDLQPATSSLVCADQVSNPKPHPEPLYLNCEQLGCAPSEAVYVGDHIRDIEAGRRAGMPTIAAAYGYIEADDNVQDWGADAIANSASEIGALLHQLMPDE